ncbi:tRNA lysidine(34) synthetase TilS [Cognatishimia activa]|uniref:tRNA lysidine(34) synthetase TilS n=1 Tax=Cognatishimia activa TaxID=1715691 RepID=UPI00223042A6|nr:tRNA lysidine(34) synthetase TilS [Cognatishimia activa]UZD89660.1 tRNA lysidine(34) synthetase TilS [Cognatishimia activa]
MQLGRTDNDLLEILKSEIAKAGATRIGIAVSGGGDSMALLYLSVALGERYTVEAITVDHGLRAESASEAEFVQRACAGQDVRHATARWTGWKGEGNLQDRARQARYSLIAEWAKRRKLHAVMIGHTLDDVAETFLIRLGREAGVDGLARMDAAFERQGMRFLRPMLEVSREDLRQFLKRHRREWREDPSNENEMFQRVRARRAMEIFEGIGISAESLARVSQNMRDAREVLEADVRNLAGECIQQVDGDLLLERNTFLEAPKELRRRLLVASISWIGQNDYAPRRAPVDELDQAITEGRNFALGGCIISVSKTRVRLAREYNAVRELTEHSPGWDRWMLEGPWQMGMQVKALGEPGLTQLELWRESALPRKSLMASPSVWLGEELIAAPLARAAEGWQAHLKSPEFLDCL